VKSYRYLWTYNPLLDKQGTPIKSESVSFSESEARWQLVIVQNQHGGKEIDAVLISGNTSLASQLSNIRAHLGIDKTILQIVQMDVGSINFVVSDKDQFLSGTQIPGILSEGQKYFYLAGKFKRNTTD
jgi:hypothetical protein